MNIPIAKTGEEAMVKKETRSYKRYKKYEKAINKASGNGRCWWIEQYLKNTIKY
tara:strand:+ start:284 stop:445 length:162 start_codon:yes stop_codon:yes gene_type:complete